MEILEKLGRLLTSRAPSDAKRRLGEAVRGTIERWKKLETGKIRWAVVPVAGWQAELLTPHTTALLVVNAIREAGHCGIDHCVIVVARTQHPDMGVALRGRGITSIRIAVQAEKLGLGHAVLTARERLPQDSPFTLILPDEMVSPRCLKAMLRSYDTHKANLVALRPLQRGDVDVYGVATLLERRGEVRRIVAIEEKPARSRKAGPAAAVIGRYVLTPEVFGELQKAARDARTGHVELTDSLDRLSNRGRVLGYFYRGSVSSMPPARRARRALEDWLPGHKQRL